MIAALPLPHFLSLRALAKQSTNRIMQIAMDCHGRQQRPRNDGCSAKSSFRLVSHLLAVIVLACFVLPADVYAANNCPETRIAKPAVPASPFEIGNCATRYTGQSYAPYEFTTKLVTCIEYTIRDAVLRMMAVIATEFGWLTAVLGTLVIIFYGVRVMTGERELIKRTITLMIKIAFVVGFINMLPTLVGWVYDIFDDLLRLVSGGQSPWSAIDRFFGTLIGVGPSITLMNGLIGLIGAAIFSSSVGLVLFFFGVIALLNMINFIIALIYTYCLAVLTIGFLLVLAPVMIPLVLFFYTERYFKTWIDIMVSAMLTPILIFSFVLLFLGIFDVLITHIFDVLGGNDFRAYWRLNNNLFSWAIPTDPNTNQIMQNLPQDSSVNCLSRTITAPVQTNINPMMGNAFNMGMGRFATLNFGANEVGIMQRLSFAFMTLWIFSSLMKSMIGLLPQIAASMAQVRSAIGAFGGNSTAVEKIQGGIDKLQADAQSGMAKDTTKFKNVESFAKSIGDMISKR